MANTLQNVDKFCPAEFAIGLKLSVLKLSRWSLMMPLSECLARQIFKVLGETVEFLVKEQLCF
jgi:hypothetical protein